MLLAFGLAVTGTATRGAATGGTAQAAPLPERPNVVVVMADDMRLDDLRFAPRVRRLMTRRGVTFHNFFSTYPLCCPARASFLTGQLPHNHGVWRNKGDAGGYQAFDDSRTIATSLSDAGYQTGFIGKYLNGYGPDRSLVSGEPSYSYVPDGWTDWRAALQNPHVPGVHGSTYFYYDTPYNVNGAVDNSYRGRYQTYVMGEFSREMVRTFHRTDAPFFVDLNFVAPHHGGPPEPDDPEPVRDDDGLVHGFPTPARPHWVEGRFDDVIDRAAGRRKDGRASEADVTDKFPLIASLPEPNAREWRALRDVTRQRAESVYVMDREVGRLVRTLKRTGEWDDTVLVFTSDNGYFLGEHRLRNGKALGYEASFRLPLLVTGPGLRGQPHGADRYDPVSMVDLSATILDLAGAQPPRLPDGSSRVTTLLEGDQGWTVPVLHEAAGTEGEPNAEFDDIRTAIGIRTSRYALLRYRNGDELYDLVADPLENHNRWGAPRYRSVRRQLLDTWRLMKDCAGPTCQVPLPPDLAAEPNANRDTSEHLQRVTDRVYGW